MKKKGLFGLFAVSLIFGLAVGLALSLGIRQNTKPPISSDLPQPEPEMVCLHGYAVIQDPTYGYMEFRHPTEPTWELCASVEDGKIVFDFGDFIIGPSYLARINQLERDLQTYRDCYVGDLPKSLCDEMLLKK